MTDFVANRPDHVPEDRVVDFDIYQTPSGETGFHDAWAGLLAPGIPGVVWTPQNGGHWIIAKGDLVPEVWKDYKRFSSARSVVPDIPENHHTLIPSSLSPPQHGHYRMLLNNGLSPKAVNAMEGEMRALAISLIDEFKAAGQCDVIADYSEKFPIQIFMKLMDLPMEHWRDLKTLADQVTRPDGSMTFRQAIEALYGFLGPYIDERRGKDGSDMISGIVNGTVKGEPLSREECLNFVTMVTMAGLDTVVNFLGFVMHYLATHPDDRRSLAQNPGRIESALEELFRRFPLVVVGRCVTQDIDFNGAQLKEGDMIVIPSPMHGLDPAANTCPMDVDFDREICAHTTFGNGPHKCAGAYLARKEVQVTLEEWLKRIPEFELIPDAKVQYSGGVVGSINCVPITWST